MNSDVQADMGRDDARPCPLCLSTHARPFRTINDIRIVRCADCALLYRAVLPSDLAVLYQEDYFQQRPTDEPSWGGSGHYVADRDRHLKTFDEHLADLERVRRPGRLLELGCATGFLLEAARRRGWEVVGLDISAYAIEYARREFHLDVRVGTVEDTQFPSQSFDAIVAFEYIEHVSDPVACLARVQPWLRSDGLLAMRTPNAGSWRARSHPDQFPGFQDSRHLAYFTRRTMRQLLRRSGFAALEIQTDLGVVTRKTLAAWGVAQPERWRGLSNRYARGLKQSIRRVAGRIVGGDTMQVYARPSACRSP